MTTSTPTVKVDLDLDDMERKLQSKFPLNWETALRLIAEVRASRAASEWRPVIGPNGLVAVDEGKSYLFAIQVSTSGAPPVWDYWEDAIFWDTESDPDFASDPGWSISDEVYFRELPSPPRSEP